LRLSNKRQALPANIQVDLTALVEGTNSFALDLFQVSKQNSGNLFFSPYGISEALAMVFSGAYGDTSIKMAETLHFVLRDNRLYQAFNRVDQELRSRGTRTNYKNGHGFQLYIVNAIWAQKNYGYLPEFLDLLTKNYGTEIRTLDFMKAPEKSRNTINKWVSDRTKKRIRDLIPQGTIDASMFLVVTNTVYLKAAWQYPFSKAATSNGPFQLADGNTIMVTMLGQTESLGYAKDDNCQAVELYYYGREFSMVIFLPHKGQFATFQESLSVELASRIISKLEQTEVVLSMPKFTFDYSVSLDKALTTMGMGLAFSSGADFSGITSGRDFFINKVLHRAFISVDEAGTEATAASAMNAAMAMPGKPVEMTVNRPFIFLIPDIRTKVMLFVGCVINPSTFTPM
jgi:serpin B